MPTNICTANSELWSTVLISTSSAKLEKLDQMLTFDLQHEATFRAVRQEFHVKRLEKLKQSHIDIDALTQQLHNSKIVKGCNDINSRCINEPSFRIFHVWRSSDLGKVQFKIDDSETATNPNVYGKLQVKLDEPDFVNPNS